MVRRVLSWDEALLVGIRRWHKPLLTRFMRMVTRLGNGEVWTFWSFAMLMAGGVVRALGWRIGIGALCGMLFAQALKRVCKRPRPSSKLTEFTALMDNPDAFSFPSGHTAAAFAVVIAVAGAGGWVAPVFLGIAVLIGISRVYLGAHYPLDVGAGAMLGSLAGVVARFVTQALI